MNFLVHDESGRIVKYGICKSVGEDAGHDFNAQAGSGETVVAYDLVPKADVQYVSGGIVIDRPLCPIKASVANRAVTLSGCPIGVPWVISGAATGNGMTDDAVMVFNFAGPGTFQVAIDPFPAQFYSAEFTVA